MLGWRQFRETRYLVNEYGHVMNMRTGKLLKGSASKTKYNNSAHGYCFRIDGKNRHFRRDFLVATLFVSNPHNYKTVAHMNGDYYDDHYKNLQWVKNIKRFYAGHMGQTGVRGVQLHKNGYYQVRLCQTTWGRFEKLQDAEFEYLDTVHAFCQFPSKRDTERYRELLPLYKK